MTRLPSPLLGKALDELRAPVDSRVRRAEDPVDFLHRYDDPVDVEVVGLLASSLAFGNVAVLRSSIARALAHLGPSPGRTAQDASFRDLRDRLHGFVHRTTQGHDVARLLHGAGKVIADRGSLGEALKAHFARAGGSLRPALGAWVSDLVRRAGAPARRRKGSGAQAELLPDPMAGSACKRLNLYLRWMVRPADGVDLGLWDLPTSALVIPLDTHVHRIARNLGLTHRSDVSWRTADDITTSLRAFDPDDPVSYDFALCHLGISRKCPSRRDPTACAACGLAAHCVHSTQRQERQESRDEPRTAPATSP